MNDIILGHPYIETNDYTAKLCVDVTEDNETKKLYFETDLEYSDYFNTENNDAFVLALLHDAMYEGKNIVSHHPVSERLLFQIRNYYIPVVSSNMPNLNKIEIIADAMCKAITSSGAVATGCSGGVDSFYTMIRYKNINEAGFRLTHVVFNNISTADNDENRIRKLYERDVVEKKKIAAELGLKAISVYSNLFKFYKSQFVYNYYFAAQYISIPYAFGKLIHIFYFSSGFSVKDFSIDHKKIKDSAQYDLFSLFCFSSDYISLYSAGSEVDRFEKTIAISDDECVRNHLQVCSEEQYEHFYVHDKQRTLEKLNCGKCGKCMRTISTLYALGKIDKFEKVFDLSMFRSNIDKFIAHELAHDASAFTRPIVKQLRANGQYSIRIDLWKHYWRIYDFLWINLRKNNAIRKLYRKVKYKENE